MLRPYFNLCLNSPSGHDFNIMNYNHMVTKTKLFNPDFFEDSKQIIRLAYCLNLISKYYSDVTYQLSYTSLIRFATSKAISMADSGIPANRATFRA